MIRDSGLLLLDHPVDRFSNLYNHTVLFSIQSINQSTILECA